MISRTMVYRNPDILTRFWHDVNRAISSQDVELCHEDVTVSRHDVTVYVEFGGDR